MSATGLVAEPFLEGLQRNESGLIDVLETVGHLATGDLIVGPPKSAAGRRTVSIPRSLLPEVAAHLETYVGPESDAFVFRGPSGVVPRRSNWSHFWRKTVKAAGIEGLRFHDLRHTGNTFAASTGASTKELMARMGHASPRAALIYQHATRERDEAIAAGLDVLIRGRGAAEAPTGSATRKRAGSASP
jgi:integrase